MLIGLDLPFIVLLLLLGITFDLLYGELPRWHPLVGFGHWAGCVERYLNRSAGQDEQQHCSNFLCGCLAWCGVVLPLVIGAYLVFNMLEKLSHQMIFLHAILLYVCIGLRSLRDHNLPIYHALKKHDLTQARYLTSRIVSRDTQQSDETEIAKASTESLLENGNDAVFGTIFWFVVAGGIGALLFRLVNTLDAMWGYRSERFNYFGRAAARIDDVMNYLPARLTACSYVLLADSFKERQRAWHCWRSQAPLWSSPNAGPVMASGAGSLGVLLGGAAVYGGQLEQRPILGAGDRVQAHDIVRAWRLVAATTALWLLLLICAAVVGLVGVGHA
jgi:adenosylcobinamide-phosphate synthase